ncbi:hypothetical protein V2W45_1467548 [Cenococcum geophilum]
MAYLEALTRIRLSVLWLLNIIKDLPTKEISELANKFKDFEIELRLLPEGAPFKVPLKACWQPPPKKKYGKANQRGKISAKIAKPNKVDKDIKEDKELPFNGPLVLYNEDLGGLEDEVVILKSGEDNDNSWLDNTESRHLSYSINLAERRVLELKGPIPN